MIMTLCDAYSKPTLARRWKHQGLQMSVNSSEGSLLSSIPTSKVRGLSAARNCLITSHRNHPIKGQIKSINRHRRSTLIMSEYVIQQHDLRRLQDGWRMQKETLAPTQLGWEEWVEVFPANQNSGYILQDGISAKRKQDPCHGRSM
jgi:hypothetical protein